MFLLPRTQKHNLPKACSILTQTHHRTLFQSVFSRGFFSLWLRARRRRKETRNSIDSLLSSLFGKRQKRIQEMEQKQRRENASSPYIRYPLVTQQQMAQISIDKYKFDVGHASFAHHSFSSDPIIYSLSDLTDPTSLDSLLPRRRPHGSPVDTLSIKAGEDAMLVSSSLVAIADGVSGWPQKQQGGELDCMLAENTPAQDKETSSGIWARSMLETVSRLITECKLRSVPHTLRLRDMQQILDDSFLHTSHLMDLQGLSGSSTLILGVLCGDTLKYINIGDSRIFVVRGGEIIATNQEQMAGDMCPSQIGTHTLGVMPSHIASVDEVQLMENDLIVMCSDGVSDNLFEWELLEALVEHLGNAENANVRLACSKILTKCKQIAYDDNAYTPYNMKVNEISEKGGRGSSSLGGKMDDMSLCIARVVSNLRGQQV